MYASIYKPILRFARVPINKILYVVLKKNQICMSLSVSLRMLLYKSLNISFQNYLYLYAYVWLKGHITQYAHISISKQISPYMSILQFPQTSHSIMQNLCFKYAPCQVNNKVSSRAILGFPNMPFSTCIHLGVNISFLVYAYIRVPKNAALYMPLL